MTTLTASTPTRVRRTAGAGAIVAALFYLLQPLAVFFLIPEATEAGFWPSPATLPGTEWQGIYEVITFSGVAIGTLVLVLSLSSLRGAGNARTLERVGTALGVIGAAGWIAVAGLSLAAKSLVAASVADTGAALEVQQAVFQEGNVILTGFIGVAALGAAGWAICFGIAAIRGDLPSRSVGIVALVGGVLAIVAAFVAVHPITGALVLIPLYLVLGIALLISSRRA